MHPTAPVNAAAPQVPKGARVALTRLPDAAVRPKRLPQRIAHKPTSYAGLMPHAPQPEQLRPPAAPAAPVATRSPKDAAAVVAGTAAVVASSVKFWGAGVLWASQLAAGIPLLWAQAGAWVSSFMLPAAAPVMAVAALAAFVGVTARAAAKWLGKAAKDATVTSVKLLGEAAQKTGSAIKHAVQESVRGVVHAAQAVAHQGGRMAQATTQAFKNGASFVLQGKLAVQLQRLGRLVAQGTYKAAVALVQLVNMILSFFGQCAVRIFEAAKMLGTYGLRVLGIKP